MASHIQKILLFLAIVTGGELVIINHKGTHFLITFSDSDNLSTLHILVSSIRRSNVTFKNNFDLTTKSYIVTRGEELNIKLHNDLRYLHSDDLCVRKKSLFIKSKFRISVYVLNFQNTSSDGYHAIPFRGLSTEYIAVTYPVSGDNHTWVLIAAKSMNTTVTIQYRVAGGGNCSRDQFLSGYEESYYLNKFEVIGTYCTGDLTGTIITSDKPITVLSGNKCARVPLNQETCDKLEEMLPPTASFGKSFALSNRKGQLRGALLYRVVARDDDTNVYVSNARNFTINRGDFYELDMQRLHNLCVTSNKPVLVVLIAKGRDSDDTTNNYGDPFFSVVPPTSHYVSAVFDNYKFQLPIEMKYYVTIFVHQNNSNSLTNLGTPDNIQSCDYAVLVLEQRSDLLIIKTNDGKPVPVGIITYGLGYQDAVGFGYPVAMLLDIDDCVSNPCDNNGQCVDGYYSYTCNCRHGFTGTHCETVISESDSVTTIAIEPSSTGAVLQGGSTYLTRSSDDEETYSMESTEQLYPATTSMSMSPTSFISITQTAYSSMSMSPTSFISITQTAYSSMYQNSDLTQTATSSMYQYSDITQTATSSMYQYSDITQTSIVESSMSSEVSLDRQTSISSCTTTAVTDASKVAMCTCSCARPPAETEASVLLYVEEIKKNLTMNRATLSKTILKRISVNDQRRSAQATGAVGVLMVIIPLAFIVLTDLFSLVAHIHEVYNVNRN